MTTTDANGILRWESTDPVTPLESTLNAGMDSVSAAVTLVKRGLINYVANTSARSALAATFLPTASKPLYVHRQDAPAGYNLEYTINGSNWYTVGNTASNTVGSAAVSTITSATYAPLPNALSVSLVLPSASRVEITGAAWMTVVATASATDLRFGIAVSGATTVAANAPYNSNSGYLSVNNNVTLAQNSSISKVVNLNAGTNTIVMQAMRPSGGTATIGYPSLSYKVLGPV
jgi:hypothetical protein